MAEFKEILEPDEDFASKLSSALEVECSFGCQTIPMVASPPVPVDSAQASAGVRGTRVVLGHGGVPVCASAGDSEVVQGQTPLGAARVDLAGGGALPFAQTSPLSAAAKPVLPAQTSATCSGFHFSYSMMPHEPPMGASPRPKGVKFEEWLDKMENLFARCNITECTIKAVYVREYMDNSQWVNLPEFMQLPCEQW